MTNILDFIPNYPEIDDVEFYQKIYNKEEFFELRLNKEYKQKEEMEYLEHQKFISRLMSSYTMYDSLLLFHSMGTGKGGVAFATSERILKDNFGINKVYVLTNSKDVLMNLKSELIFKFTGGKYIPDDYNILSRRQKTTAIKNILRMNNYVFEQFHYIAKEINEKKRSDSGKRGLIEKYSDSLFILDEIHNIKDKLKGESNVNKYLEIKTLLEMIRNKKVLLMTGTPMKDQANEITNILNLILPKEKQFIGDGRINQFKMFDTKYINNNKLTNNVGDFNDRIKGKVSYLKNVSNINKVYKGKVISELNIFKVEELEMGGLQLEKYKEAYDKDTLGVNIEDGEDGEDGEDDRAGLYNKSRQSINAVYPDGSYGGGDSEGFNKYIEGTGNYKLVSRYESEFGDIENLRVLSSKYYEIIKNIEKNNNMCHFVYSKLVNGSGIILLTLLLEKYLGYKRYQPRSSGSPELTSEGNRYILLSSDTDSYMKNRLISEFNKEGNKDGKFIRIIFGTYVIKEGLSFFNIQKVHITTPHWNYSETEQIIARAIRHDSHKYLPEEVKIEIILYVCNNVGINSIDVKMYKKSEEKDIRIKSVEKILKENAIDCQLFKERNKKEEDYSRECDYELCEYSCKDIDLSKLEIDKVTKNIYYKDEEIKYTIRKLYKKYFYLKLKDLINFFNKNSLYEILITINYFIDNNIIIYNKYGIKSYIKEDKDIFYLTDNLSEDSSNINYQYNEMSIRHLKYDIFNNKYIFKKLQDNDVEKTEKEILLKYLDDNIIEELLKSSVKILKDKEEQSNLCKYVLNIYEDKYDKLMVDGEEIYILNYKNRLCLKEDIWGDCNDKIYELFDIVEKDKIKRSKEMGLTHYGIIRTTNKYEKEIFILKLISDETEELINNYEELRGVCDGKTKIICEIEGGIIKDLVCKKKESTEDKVILRYKKEEMVEIMRDNLETVLINGEEKRVIKLMKQGDARLVNRGKECKNYLISELRELMRGKIIFEEDNKAKMCMIIKRYYIDKELILYDKYSKNFR
jgi:hypothetical protein